jgi:3-oxoacyl-[acyl-carrier protein] reductase
MSDYAGNVVVVTGASRGIGKAIAEAFAGAGADTVLAATTQATLAGVAEGIVAAGGRAPLVVAGDLKRLDKCEAVERAVRERFGRCDVLVNCAGATRAGAFVELPDEAWRDGFDLKFFAAVRLSRLLWPMLKTAQGSILNIIGGTARTPDAEFGIGGSVNAALANLTKSLAALGKRDGVRVNAIHPGLTETERYHQILAQRAAATGRPAEQLKAEQIAKSGIRRLGQPEDVAELALFLASRKASHIQGVAIAVDGGGTPGVY